MKPLKMTMSLALGHVDHKLVATELSWPITIYRWGGEDYAFTLKCGTKPLLGIGELMVLFEDSCKVVGLSDSEMTNLQVRGVIQVYQALLVSFDFTGADPIKGKAVESVTRAITLEALQHLLFLDVTEMMSHEQNK